MHSKRFHETVVVISSCVRVCAGGRGGGHFVLEYGWYIMLLRDDGWHNQSGHRSCGSFNLLHQYHRCRHREMHHAAQKATVFKFSRVLIRPSAAALNRTAAGPAEVVEFEAPCSQHRFQAKFGNALARLVPRARLVEGVRPEDMSPDAAVVCHTPAYCDSMCCAALCLKVLCLTVPQLCLTALCLNVLCLTVPHYFVLANIVSFDGCTSYQMGAYWLAATSNHPLL